jgi:chromosome partitioning protein
MVAKNQNIHREMIEHMEEKYKRFTIFRTQIDIATVIKQSQVAKEDLYVYAPKSSSWEQYFDLSLEVNQ